MTTAGLARGVQGTVARAPRPAVLWAIVVAGLAAATGTVLFGQVSYNVPEPGLQAALVDWITVPFILGGVLAWWRRPDSRFGPLMVIVGFTMFLTTLTWTTAALPHTFGQIFDLTPAALYLHAFLAYPSGRLARRDERALVGIAYVIAIGLEIVGLLLGGFEPYNVINLVSEPRAAFVLLQCELVALSVCCLAGVALLIVRRRRAPRAPRRSLSLMIDSFGVGLVMIALLFVAAAFNWPGFETIRRVAFTFVGLTPIAFLSGLLGARLARSAVGDLIIELRGDAGSVDLRDALARALRDPTVTLAYWLPEFESWADAEGQAVDLPADGDGRATRFIDREGEHVAALVHDASLSDEPELLDGVSAAAGIALENGRLHAELNARLVELRGSRGRVIEAGRKERQRLERNLHDGAQQRLVALSLELRLLERQLGHDAEATEAVGRAREEIAMSLEELRDLARGIHPAVVTAHGLAVALESLVARAPVPVRLTVQLADRLPEALEVAAYYLVCECLSNIGKHSQARSATIDVTRVNGSVVVEVADDGVGGADTERGSGLRGIADRVEALDGRVRVWTPLGHGTRVRAEMPCA